MAAAKALGDAAGARRRRRRRQKLSQFPNPEGRTRAGSSASPPAADLPEHPGSHGIRHGHGAGRLPRAGYSQCRQGMKTFPCPGISVVVKGSGGLPGQGRVL